MSEIKPETMACLSRLLESQREMTEYRKLCRDWAYSIVKADRDGIRHIHYLEAKLGILASDGAKGAGA